MYATTQDVIDRYGQSTLDAIDRDGNGSADLDAWDRALADASAQIDTYLAGRYALPLPVVPEMLKRLTVDLAVYGVARGGTAISEDQRLRYEDAIQLLRDIAAGRAALDLPKPAAAPRQEVLLGGNPRRFTRDTLKGL